MESAEIFALIDRFERSSLTKLDLQTDSARLLLERETAPPAAGAFAAAPQGAFAQPTAPAGAPAGAQLIKAPLVGTFYAAAAPGEAPFVRPGDAVQKGQTVCLLEAMKMMSEVPSPANCVIEEVLMQDGALAGFDAPLFRIRPV